jgi:hypothetical protein
MVAWPRSCAWFAAKIRNIFSVLFNRRHHVESRTKPQIFCISILKLQVLYPSVLCPCHFEERPVMIDADDAPPRFHGLCDACGNRADAAANVKHRKSRT